MAKLTKKVQNEKILKESERLNEIFIDLDENRKEVAKEMIERVAFMTIQLQILEEKIKAKGPVQIFKQGKQKMEIESPAQKTYNTMMNRYTTAYDKLFSLIDKLPEDNDDEDEDV
ncbi:hypothetical protein IHV10_22120 [Fictibacillus sp. 5RED26]|uniref:hypothetical protein n=1 Tax=Fictibacillus sp. 5RED26 TaxID=2745876 RepID=UPI0018CD0D98|nr:hypothetical protein [Fictibacillus sp. 5RED26]